MEVGGLMAREEQVVPRACIRSAGSDESTSTSENPAPCAAMAEGRGFGVSARWQDAGELDVRDGKGAEQNPSDQHAQVWDEQCVEPAGWWCWGPCK